MWIKRAFKTGTAYLGANWAAPAAYANSGLTITLPGPGKWMVAVDGRAYGGGHVQARLFNATLGVPIPNSDRILENTPGGGGAGPLIEFVTVATATVIALQAYSGDGGGLLVDDVNGKCAISFFGPLN